MEPQSKDFNLDESVQQVMQTLPPFIQTYLAEGKYTAVAQGLMTKYRLRVDQGGILERELLLLLMGIENPTEFTDALANEAKIDKETINNLIKDINEQVFVPLRKQEEELTKARQAAQVGPRTAPVLPKPPLPGAAAPLPGATVVRPMMPVAPVRPKVVIFNQQAPAKPAQPAPAHIAPLPPKTVMPAASGSLQDAVRAALASKTPDEKLMLEDHEAPHIDIRSAASQPSAPVMPKPVAPVAPVSAPAQAPKPPAPPITVQPTEPLVAPVSPRPTPPPPPGIPQVTKTPPPPPITSYSADPYREPIDES